MIDVPNLDAIDTSELERYARIFGGLSRYCALAIMVRDARRKGEIQTAKSAERKLESIYSDLPAEYRW